MSTAASVTSLNTANPRPKILHIQDPDGPHIHCAADFPAEPIQWLWPGRIPLGSITLLAGDPGTGKSLFAIDLAARVSTGSHWPDQPPPLVPSATSDSLNPEPRSLNPPPIPGSVLILSASDPLSDTIRPRLDAAGADPTRVFLLGNITNLRTDMERLRAAIDATPNLRLLVIDPINFYVGPGDAHFQTVVRTVLEPLAELARKKQFAILAITHFRKNDGAAIRRAAGSMGFVATARAIWTLATDPHDPTRRELLPLKNNLSGPTPGLAFLITSTSTCSDLNAEPRTLNPQTAPHLVWDPTPVEFADRHAARKRRPSTPRDEALSYLRAALADGPRPASELLELADARGLTRRTIQRAFHDLDGHTSKRGFRAGWWWSLGEYPIATIPKQPLDDCDNPMAEPTYAADVADQISAARIFAETRCSAANDLAPPRKKLSPSPPVSPSPIAAENRPAAEPAAAAKASSPPTSPVAFAPTDDALATFLRAWLLADDQPAPHPVRDPRSPVQNPPPRPQNGNPKSPIRNRTPAPAQTTASVPIPDSHFALHTTPTPAY